MASDKTSDDVKRLRYNISVFRNINRDMAIQDTLYTIINGSMTAWITKHLWVRHPIVIGLMGGGVLVGAYDAYKHSKNTRDANIALKSLNQKEIPKIFMNKHMYELKHPEWFYEGSYVLNAKTQFLHATVDTHYARISPFDNDERYRFANDIIKSGENKYF